MVQNIAEKPTLTIRVIELIPRVTSPLEASDADTPVTSTLSAVFFPLDQFKVAKQFWQHSGDGVSSRRAEFCQRQLDEGKLVEANIATQPAVPRSKGPRRYSKLPKENPVNDNKPVLDGIDATTFLEERFGRNLGMAFVGSAKLAVRRRIAGTLRSDVGPNDALALPQEGGREVDGFTEDEVYLYPSGMSAIFNSHRSLLSILGARKSVCYRYISRPGSHY